MVTRVPNIYCVWNFPSSTKFSQNTVACFISSGNKINCDTSWLEPQRSSQNEQTAPSLCFLSQSFSSWSTFFYLFTSSVADSVSDLSAFFHDCCSRLMRHICPLLMNLSNAELILSQKALVTSHNKLFSQGQKKIHTPKVNALELCSASPANLPSNPRLSLYVTFDYLKKQKPST